MDHGNLRKKDTQSNKHGGGEWPAIDYNAIIGCDEKKTKKKRIHPISYQMLRFNVVC